MEKNMSVIVDKIVEDCKKSTCSYCKSQARCKRFFPEWVRPERTSKDILSKYVKEKLTSLDN